MKKNASKRLAAITELAFNVIAQASTKPAYRQRSNLGSVQKHCLRVKFFQQHRLFFCDHGSSKVTVLAWVNGEDTQRALGSGGDAHKVLRRMLESGHPPDDWNWCRGAAFAAGRRAALRRKARPRWCAALAWATPAKPQRLSRNPAPPPRPGPRKPVKRTRHWASGPGSGRQKCPQGIPNGA